MNVSLTPQLEKLVSEHVASGLYHSASEVIRAGLRLLKEQEELKQQRLMTLRRQIGIVLRQSARGESKPLKMAAIKAAVARRAGRKRGR